MGLQNDTSTTADVADKGGDVGTDFGQSASDLIGFYGKTPIVQPTDAAQAAITNTLGTASATSGIQALTSTYNSTLIQNALATLWAQSDAMRTALVNIGLIKGS